MISSAHLLDYALASLAVIVIPGPSVLFENATKSVRAKKCSRLAYFFAIALSSYWAFVIGLLTIQIGISI